MGLSDKIKDSRKRKKYPINKFFPEINNYLTEKSEVLTRMKEESSPLYWMTQPGIEFNPVAYKETSTSAAATIYNDQVSFPTKQHINKFIGHYMSNLEQAFSQMDESSEKKEEMVHGFQTGLVYIITDYINSRLFEIAGEGKGPARIHLNTLENQFKGTLDNIKKIDLAEYKV